MLGVRESMERDGWGPAMRARDALPDDWHPTAEMLRFVWWRYYGVPEPEPPTPNVQEPPKPQPRYRAARTSDHPLGSAPNVTRPVPVNNGLGGTRRDGLASAGVAALIICGAVLWSAILDSVVGLDTLRRLLGFAG